ncbi:hypothetical protein [Tautonia plasticadhaerens]|uniref:Uncharacterized protein n=1 Tax=Tautonia plasticadhaerens TaxID=2527974 RepID=A0A518HAW4_9BACT|nr:hypothetical protein [Tautonia plasticadhaerens]QDV38002.1 hypothetical protein ElP_59490 [Tautonia plasticadhaerens]
MFRPLALLVLVLGPTPTAVEDPGTIAADRVVLRDGTTLLGQVSPTRSTRVEVVVRRSWVEQLEPGRLVEWEALDRRARHRARANRLDRLRRWREDRRSMAEIGPDPIAEWLDGELDRLSGMADAASSPLMVVSVDRRDVTRVESQAEDRRRMLRQGWRAGFDDVETMPLDRLRAGLQARGFAIGDIDPAPIDDLLPTPIESDRRWLARRASTEVLTDHDLRLVRFGDLVMPDAGPGGAQLDRARLAGVVGDLVGDLLGAPPSQDPMRPLLGRIEASGRVGAVLTSLEVSQDLDRVAVESVLLVRTGPARWERAAWRRAEASTADLPADAGRELARDPQIQSAFDLLQGLGIGGADPQAKRLGLAVGAATQQAMARAGAALDADLRSAALRLDRPDASQPPGERPR